MSLFYPDAGHRILYNSNSITNGGAMSETQRSGSDDLNPIADRLLAIVMHLSTEYQQFVVMIGKDGRVPKDVRKHVVEHAREVIAEVSRALDEVKDLPEAPKGR
jgi:hypothetical protein